MPQAMLYCTKCYIQADTMPRPIILSELDPPVKSATNPMASTRADLRDGSRGDSGGDVTPDPIDGGSPALAYAAPSGLADGNEITVTTDGSEGWDFGVAPESVATLGFGQGLLYTAALGPTIQSHIDPHSGAAWHWEREDFGLSRQIAEYGGLRAMHITAGSGGFWSWHLPEFLPENSKLFISTWNRADYAFVNSMLESFEIATVSASEITLVSPYTGPTNSNIGAMAAADPANEDAGKYGALRVGFTNGSNVVSVVSGNPVEGGMQPGWFLGRKAASQWKGIRITDTGGYGSELAAPGRNDFYETPNNGTESGFQPGRNRWVYMNPSNIYGFEGAMWFREWTRADHQLTYGSFGGTDSKASSNIVAPTENLAEYNKNETVSLSLHDTNRRTGAVSWQDFTVGVLEPSMMRTDYLVQTGSFARFELTNSALSSTTTEAHILPPFLVDWTPMSVKLLLWKALMTDYSGKYLHFYDSDGIFRKAVAL